MKPLVSVVLSTYNQRPFLAQSLTSILEQDFTNFELLILNDASTDGSDQLLKKIIDPRVSIVNHRRNQGLAASLNRLISRSRGEFIARMDADDIARRSRLSIQVDYLQKHPSVAGCGSQAILIDIKGHKVGLTDFPQTYSAIKKTILRYNPFVHSTMMIRKQLLRRFRGYAVSLNGAEDYDLWLRMAAHYPLINLSQPLVRFRVNPQGLSWSNLKRVELQAIRARFRALSRQSYPLWQIIFLVKPLVSLFIPAILKKKIFLH